MEFEKRVLMGHLNLREREREGITGGWRKLYNEELLDL
jgi:hypothetical protein